MCYYVATDFTQSDIKNIYSVGFQGQDFNADPLVNGYAHSLLPVILDEDPGVATSAVWGLVPEWSKDRKIQKQTLNARIETLEEKPSFKNSIEKRALVLVKGFYEWKWIDGKGKVKHKHFLSLPGNDIFALGGIYNRWTDQETGELLTTFSIVTTQANELMSEIHNTKHRMPVVLTKALEKDWLANREIEDFAFPNHEANLKAINLDAGTGKLSLF